MIPKLSDVQDLLAGGRTSEKITRIRVHHVSDSVQYRPLVVKANASSAAKCVSTYSVDSVETLCPAVSQLLTEISNRINVDRRRASSSLFVSPAGTGVPWHFDGSEVFVFTLAGRRRWRISPNLNNIYPAHHFVPGIPAHPDIYAEANGPLVPPEEYLTYELSTADAMFLPRGVWHSTMSLDSSVSLSIAVASETPLEALMEGLHKAQGSLLARSKKCYVNHRKRDNSSSQSKRNRAPRER